jgi:hypothetical protein
LKEYEFHVNSGMDIIQDPNVEKKGNKRTQFVFVDDDNMIRIEDKTEEGCTILDDPSETLPVMGQTNVLDKQCRGCGKIMERLPRHLKSKKGELCMTKYKEEEIKMHSLALTATRNSNYREKNYEKVKEKKREYREKNNEKIREYREKNNEKIRESMKKF